MVQIILSFSGIIFYDNYNCLIPHFSADVEKMFSQINRIKTKSTSSLKPEKMENRLLAKQSIPRKNKHGVAVNQVKN